MKELALISQTTPAVVTFNYDEINKQLDEVLKKYGGLLFTDKTVAECKKSIAELKKGKKSLSDFRIKTKKLLTEDITKFEDQCKLLSDKFDTVIDPISVQADAFEVNRRAEKQRQIGTLINTLADERLLADKYITQLVVTEQMLNKGTKIKDIKENLTKQADILLSQQNMEKANIELIKSKVELANAQYGVTLLNNLYLSLLEDGNEVNSLIEMIIENAENTKIAAEEAEAEQLAIENRKAERLAKVEVERAAQAEQRELDRVASEARKAEREKQVTAERKAKFERECLEKEAEILRAAAEISSPVELSVPAIANIESQIFVENYKVEGTEEALNALEDFLNDNSYKWSPTNV